MTKPTTPHVRPRFAGPDDIDSLLEQFFQQAVPDPWPACPVTVTEDRTPPPVVKVLPWRWLRLPGRLAIAAAVAGLVFSYVALQSSFTEPRPAVPTLTGSEVFGLKTGVTIERTRSGQPVAVEVEPTPDPKKFILRLQELPVSK